MLRERHGEKLSCVSAAPGRKVNPVVASYVHRVGGLEITCNIRQDSSTNANYPTYRMTERDKAQPKLAGLSGEIAADLETCTRLGFETLEVLRKSSTASRPYDLYGRMRQLWRACISVRSKMQRLELQLSPVHLENFHSHVSWARDTFVFLADAARRYGLVGSAVEVPATQREVDAFLKNVAKSWSGHSELDIDEVIKSLSFFDCLLLAERVE